jgi:energy-coupling factor transporter ATP-binding protein EcfA2
MFKIPQFVLGYFWYHIGMNILVTGTPGSGKTTLVRYAQSVGDDRFVDADELEGLCEWREFATGKVLGPVAEHKDNSEDNWYAKYGWYWKPERLKQFLSDNPRAILCGSAENIVECYDLFGKIFIMQKDEHELLSNLSSPDRVNPFGKTPEQRKGFMKWQDYLTKEAERYNPVILTGNDISKVYASVTSDFTKPNSL